MFLVFGCGGSKTTLLRGVIPSVIKRNRKYFLIEWNTSGRCENILLLKTAKLHKCTCNIICICTKRSTKWIKDYTCRYVLPDRWKEPPFVIVRAAFTPLKGSVEKTSTFCSFRFVNNKLLKRKKGRKGL